MHSRGYTLLEIIAVVVLITILVALIVPILFKARESGHQVSCASNLKQIGMAMFMYADAPSNEIFPSLSVKKDPFADSNPMEALNLLYSGYISDPRVFSCPMNPIPAAALKRVYVIGPMRKVERGKSPLTWANCSYGYDPGHSPNDAVTTLLADKKGNGSNSDNHGPNAGQCILIGGGTVVLSKSAQQESAVDSSGNATTDDDIYSLNTHKLPRNLDAFLRQ